LNSYLRETLDHMEENVSGNYIPLPFTNMSVRWYGQTTHLELTSDGPGSDGTIILQEREIQPLIDLLVALYEVEAPEEDAPLEDIILEEDVEIEDVKPPIPAPKPKKPAKKEGILDKILDEIP